MMKRIVAGTDGSPGASQALRWAARMAAGQGAEVVVMTGHHPADIGLPPEQMELLQEAQARRLEEWSEAAELGDTSVRAVVVPGDPRPGILQLSEETDADLVVVGRSGTSAGPGPLHLGSLAEWLAHHADRPLAVVGGRVHLGVRSLLVGVDGSPGSRAALGWVADLASSTDVRVIAATVEQALIEWTPATSPKNWRRDSEEQVRSELAADLTAAGVEFEVLALSGINAADALLQAAREERADLVVVGMRGLGGFTGLRIGGVALKVLHRADRPVVLAPVPANR